MNVEVYQTADDYINQGRYSEALNLLESITNDGGAFARIGDMYLNGQGVPINQEKAFEYYLKGAELNDKYSYFCLSMCYEDGIGTEQNENLAFESLKKAAELGVVPAKRLVGTRYLHGVGVESSYYQGVQWLKSAAEDGDSEAQRYMGIFCRDGFSGVNCDSEMAKEWFRKAIENGDKDSKLELVTMLLNDLSKGINIDKKEAFTLANEAMQDGNAKAYYCLSIFYNMGIFVPVDLEKAYQLVQIAANNGYPAAMEDVRCYKKNLFGKWTYK